MVLQIAHGSLAHDTTTPRSSQVLRAAPPDGGVQGQDADENGTEPRDKRPLRTHDAGQNPQSPLSTSSGTNGVPRAKRMQMQAMAHV